MNSLTLDPIARVEGTVNLPGSKSVSNRALLLAALAHGTTRLTNLLDSDDIRHMLNALQSLGVRYELSADKTQCVVQGLGRAFAAKEPLQLFLGNAGTAMRPLCAALCLGSGEFTLTGEPRMEERPIGHLVDALREAGAQIHYLKNDGYPPLTIDAKGLWGGRGPHQWLGFQPVPHRLLDGRPAGCRRYPDQDPGRAGVQALHRHHAAYYAAVWRAD